LVPCKCKQPDAYAGKKEWHFLGRLGTGNAGKEDVMIKPQNPQISTGFWGGYYTFLDGYLYILLDRIAGKVFAGLEPTVEELDEARSIYRRLKGPQR
jgi:hypothetical protein